ncbi:DUF445 family protein [Solimonas sp. K1W22B-7]|uniref:DUF445 domain-containing protein n=1 Tax=Solimonas sp. K1W22B-7 TaxID=2303331 RepID=UPI000E336045|nr:DUF445 family protein [Solimonas sp. K1W22B-7]AXQ31111.1 DUF445 family protein [Solimonas sp. K1W22B-7]
MNTHSVIAEIQAHAWLYLSMPLIAAFVGYVTKLLALEMMFRPLEFVGIRPYLGWQGVVPRKAEKMAGTATDLLLGNIIRVDELVQRLDPVRMVREVEPLLQGASEDLAREIGERYIPGFWKLLPEFARKATVRRVQAEIPRVAVLLWQDIALRPSHYLDMRHLLVANLVRDKALLNDIFRRIGGKEFVFFRNAGFWFGLLLGLVQLACWMTWHQPWLLPAFGAFVGLTSDWIALQMMFRPLYPKKFLGITLHGKFIARQKEVARDYASLIARELLTPANMIEELLRGPFADRVVDLLQQHVRNATDEQLGLGKPLVVAAMGSSRYGEIRRHIVVRLLELLPQTSREIEQYALDALDINNTIVARMDLLTPEQFEGLLRPAFKEDEKTLVLCGAVLGFAVGELQVHLMI